MKVIVNDTEQTGLLAIVWGIIGGALGLLMMIGFGIIIFFGAVIFFSPIWVPILAGLILFHVIK